MEEQNMNNNGPAPEAENKQADQAQQAQPQTDASGDTIASDAGEHKAMAIIGYIFPVLFFIPLLSDDGKKSAYAMLHANQQLNILLAAVALMVVNVIPFLGQLIWFIGSIALFVFVIMGIINAAGGKMKKLPLIGNIELLK